MLRFCLLTAAALCAFTAAPAFAEPGYDDPADAIVLTYVPAYKPVDVEALPYDRLTHICHAFATANPDGSLLPGETMPQPRMMELAKQHNTKVLLSLGGAESDALLAPVAADPQKLARFIDEIIAYVVDHGYDGVDVDWEFPDSEASAAGMIKLVQGLDLALQQLEQETGRDYLMTRAVGGGWAYTHIPTEIFVDHFDFLNVMCYDNAGPWEEIAGHHSVLNPSPQAQRLGFGTVQSALNHWKVERGVPVSQLVLGLPAYARGFKNTERYGTIEKNSDDHTVYSYGEIVGLMYQGWAVDRLENGEPWLIAPDGSEVIGFDDPASISEKAKWAAEQGLAGVFFWEASQDLLPDGSTPLLDAAVTAFRPDKR